MRYPVSIFRGRIGTKMRSNCCAWRIALGQYRFDQYKTVGKTATAKPAGHYCH